MSSCCSVCNRYPCPGCLGAALDEIVRLKARVTELESAPAHVIAGKLLPDPKTRLAAASKRVSEAAADLRAAEAEWRLLNEAASADAVAWSEAASERPR